MQIIFNNLVQQGLVSYSRLSNTRIKVHTPCQWSCGFCHMEGNHNSASVKDIHALKETLLIFREQLGFESVHFTGGEPSIHPQIVDYVRLASSMGFEVKMTTNAQVRIEKYIQLAEAGLCEINVSIHTLDGNTLSSVMAPPRSIEWGARAIQKQIEVIKALKRVLIVKVNTVASDDLDALLAIAQFVRSENVAWRIMDELDNSERSFATIRDAMKVLGATPTRAEIIQGSSSCGIHMTCADNFTFKVKMIRNFKIPGMCDNCPVDKAGNCKEYAYGPRIEGREGELLVRSCLYRNDEEFLTPVKAYSSHPHCIALKRCLT